MYYMGIIYRLYTNILSKQPETGFGRKDTSLRSVSTCKGCTLAYELLLPSCPVILKGLHAKMLIFAGRNRQ